MMPSTSVTLSSTNRTRGATIAVMEITAYSLFPDAPTSTPEDIPVLPIYDEDGGLDTVFFVSVFLMLILGTSGNVLVIATVLINRHLRKVQYVFVVNLAVADLCITSALNGMHLVSIRTHGRYLRLGLRCEIVGFLCTIGCATSLSSLAAIAFNRYIAICHHQIYPLIYSKRTIPLLVASTWFAGIGTQILSWVLRSNKHRIVPELFLCVTSLLEFSSAGQSVAFWLVIYALPMSLIIFCYLRIWFYTQASKKSLRKLSGDGRSQSRVLTNNDRRLLRSLLTLVIAVIVLLGPFYLIFSFRVSVSRVVLVASFLLYHLNSCINCFLYALINRDFRRGYRGVFDRFRRLVRGMVYVARLQ